MASDLELLIRINGNAKDFDEELKKLSKKTEVFEKKLAQIAKISAVAFVGTAAAIAIAVRESSKFEDALVGVGKTTDIEGKKLVAFGKKVEDLATSGGVPVLATELLNIAEAAGQLGVTAEKNLLKFTETVAKLGVSTDLTGVEAATALTRILTVTKEGVGDIDIFGSVIVALGNNFAATESEIVRMTTEVSRSIAIFKVSAAQSAGLAAALKSIGVQAQLGGSATGRAFRAIQKSIENGGDSLKNLSALTGIAGDQLKQTFEDDAVGVFQKFLEGLNSLDPSEINKKLGEFGLKGEEILKVLPPLAQNAELVARAMRIQAKETKNATALNIEAAKAFAKSSSRVKLFKNEVLRLVKGIGDGLVEALLPYLDWITESIGALNGLTDESKKSIATFIKWVAIITGGIAAMAAFALGAIKVSAIVVTLTAVFGTGTIAAGGFWAAVTGPIGIAVAGILALGGAIGFVSSKMNEGRANIEQNSRSLSENTKLLEKQLEKRKELNKAIEDVNLGTASSLPRLKNELSAIEDQIKKTKELRQEQIKNSESFGTGEFLVAPKATSGELDFSLPGEIKIPLSPESAKKGASADSSEVDERKRIAEEIKKIDEERFDSEIALRKKSNNLKRLEIADGNQFAIDAARENLEIDQEIQNLKQENQKVANSNILQSKKDTQIQQNNIEIELLNQEKDKVEEKRKIAQELSDIEDARLQNATDLRRQSLEIEQAELTGGNERQIELAKQKIAILEELNNLQAERESTLIIEQDEKRKELELAQQETEIASLLAQRQKIVELEQEFFLEDQEKDAEFNEIKGEIKSELDEEELEGLKNQLLTKKEAQQEVEREQLQNDVKRRNDFLVDEEKFGTGVANLKSFFNKSEVQGVKSTANTLSQLQQSQNSKLKSIGKAAARVRAAISTAEGAIGAYTSLASIPFVGPVLGAAAAGAIIAFGVEQQQKISSAQRGGVVPDINGLRDRQLTLTEPGEIIIPKPISPDFIQSIGRPDVTSESGDGQVPVLGIALANDFLQFVEEGLEERRSLGVTSSGAIVA